VSYLHNALVSHLVNDGNVSARISARAAWGQPDESWEGSDYVTLSRIGHGHERAMTSGQVGLARAMVQLSAWSSDPQAAFLLANDIRLALDGFSGTMGTAPNTVTVRGAFLRNEVDDYEAESTGAMASNYRVIQEWEIVHAETAVDLVGS